jgi:hypothetical protein
MNFPYHYGDCGGSFSIKERSFISKRVGSVILLTFMLTPTPAYAIDVLKAFNNTKEVSQLSFSLTCFICATAGAACIEASKTAVRNDPKVAVPLVCVGLMSWCAAKASPL